MPQPLESYALIGDLQTAALVSRTGSVDWLCLPRFDGPAVFAALLGDERHGCWQIRATGGSGECTTRRYRGDTLILETTWETSSGTARVVDFMPPRGEAPDIVRIVEGVEGRVEMTSTLRLRFDYGSVLPVVHAIDGGFCAIAGPDAVYFEAPVTHDDAGDARVATFSVNKGERVPFVLTWQASHLGRPKTVNAEKALADTDRFWTEWVSRCTYDGEWRDAVVRSLVTLRALTYDPTAGMVAAVTTSLPEKLGGDQNWDYRFCWLRDATMTLHALVYSGYDDEARRWREWLLRSLAGDPHELRIMYGIAGERRIPEHELHWLPGYENSKPVRVGNQASKQFQLDVFGELLDAFHLDRAAGLSPTDDAWSVQLDLVDVIENRWREPDAGLWETRGDPQHFVHSKVMAWAGVDRAVQAVERFGLEGPVDRWRRLRDEIHAEVCDRGYDAERNTFVQAYGSNQLDGSALLIPQVGFLPGDDPRVAGTVEAIGRALSVDGGLVYRHEASEEGTFTACSLWYADALDLVGRPDEGRAVFERVLALRNDVGLLAEEYDVHAQRQIGNTPQAFSHVALMRSARALSRTGSRAGRVHRHDPPKLQ